MAEQTPVYIKEVEIEDFRCFKGKHDFSFVDDNGNWCRWTVFLGDNNTGKTNLLKAIASLTPPKNKEQNVSYSHLLITLFSKSLKIKIYTDKENNISDYDFGYKSSETGIILNSPSPAPTNPDLEYLSIYGYGVVREKEQKGISDTDKVLNADNLLDNSKLINFEEWLFQLDYTAKNETTSEENRKKARERRDLLIEVLTSEVFPEICGIRFNSNGELRNFLTYQVEDGWHHLSRLGYGYQATLSWIADFCKKLFDRYPDSENPLKEPAVLLIDEIDLHLHPQWQRTIINYLSKIFTQTQFIVTTHSPFIIQSMEKVNLYTLKREGDHTNVQHLGCRSFIGWRIEEILSEVMGLNDNIQTDIYQKWMNQFDKAMDTDNYKQGKEAYDELIKILHPQSVERKLLKIQFSQLLPDDKA
ncbi:recombination protein F [Bacteroidales bacterium Barb6]|nr:recombination protein F [Bacteroidales bacterium Barb6]